MSMRFGESPQSDNECNTSLVPKNRTYERLLMAANIRKSQNV